MSAAVPSGHLAARGAAHGGAFIRACASEPACTAAWRVVDLTCSSTSAASQVMYSQFLDAVKGGRVSTVRFDDATKRVYFDLQHPAATGACF